MKTIVCVDNNWGIGSANQLLYSIPGDMKFFREKTTGKVVVMGLATFLSFPKQQPLKNRVNIVISNDDNFQRDDVIICSSIDEGLDKIKEYNSDDVYVIGGASIYAQMIDYCDTAYITKVDASRPADKFFPNLDEKENWVLTDVGEKLEHEGLFYKFCTYKNKTGGVNK